MSISESERRMAANEVVFRQHNESIKRGFDEVRKLARESSQEHLIPENDMELYFLCECSDENCTKRLRIKPSHYNRIHVNRKQFIIATGHEVAEIERTITETPDYSVVEKRKLPPQSARVLQPTDVDNT